jgi:hypothetical protein
VPSDERRRKLRRLSDMLDALVALHLDGDRAPSAGLYEDLAEIGIKDPQQHSVQVLIKRLVAIQKLYMGRMAPDRRTSGKRRS